VQTVLPLGNNTAIKLTTARYYTRAAARSRPRASSRTSWSRPVFARAGQCLRLREADLDKHPDQRQTGGNEDAGEGCPTGNGTNGDAAKSV